MLTLYGYGYDNPQEPFKVWFKWDRNVDSSQSITALKHYSTREIGILTM